MSCRRYNCFLVTLQEEVMFFLETESATYNCTFIMKTKGVLLSKISFQLVDGNYFLFATYARGISPPSVPLQLVLEQYNFGELGLVLCFLYISCTVSTFVD